MTHHASKRLSTRYRAARRRLTAAYSDVAEQRAAARCLARSVVDCRRLGLDGSALIVAAEYMACTRLRQPEAAVQEPAELVG